MAGFISSISYAYFCIYASRNRPRLLKFHTYLPLPKGLKYSLMLQWLRNTPINTQDFQYLTEGLEFYSVITKHSIDKYKDKDRIQNRIIFTDKSTWRFTDKSSKLYLSSDLCEYYHILELKMSGFPYNQKHGYVWIHGPGHYRATNTTFDITDSYPMSQQKNN